MSGAEIRTSARFQRLFADKYGHSKFVTMVIQRKFLPLSRFLYRARCSYVYGGRAFLDNDKGEIEPACYQVSDQCGKLALALDAFTH